MLSATEPSESVTAFQKAVLADPDIIRQRAVIPRANDLVNIYSHNSNFHLLVRFARKRSMTSVSVTKISNGHSAAKLNLGQIDRTASRSGKFIILIADAP
jgi:hypothetical protein